MIEKVISDEIVRAIELYLSVVDGETAPPRELERKKHSEADIMKWVADIKAEALVRELHTQHLQEIVRHDHEVTVSQLYQMTDSILGKSKEEDV